MEQKFAAQGSKLVEQQLEARRYNTKKCSGCGVASTVLVSGRVDEVMPNGNRWLRSFIAESGATLAGEYASLPVVECRGCRKHMLARPVVGRVVLAKKCDARCMHASSHSCECACGGKNHGAGQVAA